MPPNHSASQTSPRTRRQEVEDENFAAGCLKHHYTKAENDTENKPAGKMRIPSPDEV